MQLEWVLFFQGLRPCTHTGFKSFQALYYKFIETSILLAIGPITPHMDQRLGAGLGTAPTLPNPTFQFH